MANENTTTIYTNIINTELIVALIADYELDAAVIAPTLRFQSLAGMGTKVATFEKWTKGTGPAAVSELGATTNVAMGLTEASLTAAKVAIRRQVTEEALQTTKLGYAGLEDRIAFDAAQLMTDKVEADAGALITSITANVNHTGQDNSIATVVEAQAKLRVSKVRSGFCAQWHPQAAFDLRRDIATTGATLLGPDASQLLGLSADGVLGMFLGMPNYETGNCPTSGGDCVSAVYVDARQNERQAALALAQLWDTKLLFIPQSDVSYLYIFHKAYAVGIINQTSAAKVTTSAS
jgi:hypothetical protein